MSIRHAPTSAVTRRARVRVTEGIGPRPSELLADRLFATAAVARRSLGDPAPIDAEALATLASVQRRDEEELIARWEHFRDYYLRYLEALGPRESTLQRALDTLAALAAAHAGDPKVRSALRVCRMRRPPLAKVEAIVAAASGDALGVAVTESRRKLRPDAGSR